MEESKAWQELKTAIALIPAEDLPTFFHGTVDERDELMDRLGLCRETWWLVGVLRLAGDEG